jgi:hypothetical protein
MSLLSRDDGRRDHCSVAHRLRKTESRHRIDFPDRLHASNGRTRKLPLELGTSASFRRVEAADLAATPGPEG